MDWKKKENIFGATLCGLVFCVGVYMISKSVIYCLNNECYPETKCEQIKE